ncbi:MAG: rRNA pseudouridine synthase [bacterium]|nr:rRNA pseudouridine synthase [bacterium]
MTAPDDTMRLNRYLARCGLGSRRAVEELITAGRVSVDGVPAKDLGRRVVPGQAEVSVDGVPTVLPSSTRIYAFHKPHGVVSTLKAQGGQPSLLPYRNQSDLPERFIPVGRLDAASTGLLLWTDDGELAQRLLHPSSGLWKTYELELDRAPADYEVAKLMGGRLRLDGRPVRPCRLALQDGGTIRQWIMELHEGRKRQIRRMCGAVGLKVRRLHRVAIGPIQLGLLRPGDFRRLDSREEKELRLACAGRGTRDERDGT